MKNVILLFVGPSGAGKSSFLDKALKDYPQLRDVVTCTTRPMRKGESEGNPYFFLEEARFRQLINEGYFVEWAEVHGRLYGVPQNQILEAWKDGCAVIMDIDIQGARTLRAKYPQARSVFIMPPSIDALRQRVIKREGSAPKDLDLRMENARAEMLTASEFEYQVINEDFDNCYQDIQKIIEETLGLH